MTTDPYDVIIICGGAAGLSAGLVLARAQASVLLIDGGQPRNAPANEMHGFISRDGMSPACFLASGRDEVTGYGGIIRAASVASTDRGADGSFAVTLTDGTVERSRALLIATGLTDELPLIPGVRDRWGTLVHHCPYCHGFEVLGKQILVLGGPARELSLKQAGLLRSFSDRVTFVTNDIQLTDLERNRLDALGVRVQEGAVSHIVGQPGSLDGIQLTDGTVLDAEAVFIAPRQRPNDALLRTLGCDIDAATSLIAVDQFGQTSVPGVWAAGNVVTPTAQVITAACAASASAIAINGWLLERKISNVTAQN
ncbi:NAD(P)/FAD-dependent oxidoreductase [soil metagenome]